MTLTLKDLERSLSSIHEATVERPPQLLLEHMVRTPIIGPPKRVKLEVFSDEHPPPHFRVSYDGSSANFAIETGLRLDGNAALAVKDSTVAKWWRIYRVAIAELWNKTRPTGCTVGEFVIPAEWH